MIEARRGDVVLVAFPFVGEDGLGRKRRPAVVIQSDRYRQRAAVILAAITSSHKGRELPCKVTISRDSPQGQSAGLRTDSVVDCQTLLTLPRSELVARLGSFLPETLKQIDRALEDALALPGPTAEF